MNISKRTLAALCGLAAAIPATIWAPPAAAAAPPARSAATSTLVLDDGSAENSMGITGGGQFLWFNRFTPPAADFPLRIEEIQVLFTSGGGAEIGHGIDLFVWQDTDGDPSNGATFVGSLWGVPVQKLDAFSSYQLPVPIRVENVGDVLIGVVNRATGTAPGEFPAAIDQSPSQGRSWIGIYGGNPAYPPVLSAATIATMDSLASPGNWMIRATYGPAAPAPVRIDAGGAHTCALNDDGTVVCWGKNTVGQLGDGTHADSTTPVPVSGLTDVISISTGSSHSCALKSDGTIWCWGNDYNGQLGDGGGHNSSSTPVAVSAVSNAVAVAAGGSHTCALASDGSVVCWGSNGFGQLGNGSSIIDSTTPVPVTMALSNAVAITSGYGHSCMVHDNGAVSCWGRNGSGQLGDGSHNPSSTPVPAGFPLLSDATAVAAGNVHTCALKQDGSAVCWGGNDHGQLGDGSTTSSNSPVAVTGIPGWAYLVAVAAGGGHSCALTNALVVYCWGNNDDGQVGDGSTTDAHSATLVLYHAVAISAGVAHSCALKFDGTAACWGANAFGQIGNDVRAFYTSPQPVQNFGDLIFVNGFDPMQ